MASLLTMDFLLGTANNTMIVILGGGEHPLQSPVSSELFMSRLFWGGVENQRPLLKGVMEGSSAIAAPTHAKTTPQTTPTTVISHRHSKGLGKQGMNFCLLRDKDIGLISHPKSLLYTNMCREGCADISCTLTSRRIIT